MATIEERLTQIEQEHGKLREKVELQTIAISAMGSKAALENLKEQYGKLFDALIGHDQLTNDRLTDLQSQIIELDGKTVGLQTEMRQSFQEQDGKIVGLQTEMRKSFQEQGQWNNRIEGLLQQ